MKCVEVDGQSAASTSTISQLASTVSAQLKRAIKENAQAAGSPGEDAQATPSDSPPAR